MKSRLLTTRNVVFMGMFGALAAVLMLFEFPLPFIAPSFYGLDPVSYTHLDVYKRQTLNDRIPAIWYAMAREYDRLGEYEKGIEACKKALALLPEQDHGSDWYGINYHCSRLLSLLQEEVKR